MLDASKIRDQEKADNLEAIQDGGAGAEAVRRAIVILKEFYSAQESFVQTSQVPEMAAYNGMQSNKGGVIGMLEVIETDFLRLKADSEAAEKTAAAEHEEFMSKSQASKKQKHDQEFQLRLQKDEDEFQRSRTTKELRSTEDELEKAMNYFEQLQPTCITVRVSWEQRVAKRNEELAAP